MPNTLKATGWTVRGSNIWWAEVSETVQIGTGSHLASSKMGPRLFSGVKQPRLCVKHPTLSSAEVKERVELYLYFPNGPSLSVMIKFTFT